VAYRAQGPVSVCGEEVNLGAFLVNLCDISDAYPEQSPHDKAQMAVNRCHTLLWATGSQHPRTFLVSP